MLFVIFLACCWGITSIQSFIICYWLDWKEIIRKNDDMWTEIIPYTVLMINLVAWPHPLWFNIIILTSPFSKPPFFCIGIQKELHCNNLPVQQLSRKQHTFGKRDNSLLFGINYRRQWLIQEGVSSKISFKSWFAEVLVYFSIWDSNTYFFKYDIFFLSIQDIIWGKILHAVIDRHFSFFISEWFEDFF